MAKKTSSAPALSSRVLPAPFAGPEPELLQRAVKPAKIPVSTTPHVRCGTVVALHQDIGVGYVKESESGLLYGLSRKFIGAKIWGLLRENIEIEFEDNGRNAASKVFLPR